MTLFAHLTGARPRAKTPQFTIRCHPSVKASERRCILAALDRMSFHSVEAVWLVDVCELSYEEAATAARTTLPDFAKRLHRARHQVFQTII